MNEKDFGVMENQILAEENSQAPLTPGQEEKQSKIPKIDPKQLAQNTKNKLIGLKKVKIIAIFSTLFGIVLLLVLFVVLSTRSTSEPQIDPDIIIASPVPQNTSRPEFREIEKEQERYNDKVNSIQKEAKDFLPPSIDPAITF